jgi:transposase-like protein
VSVYRWVKRFTPLLIDAARPCRRAPGDRWFVDESMSKAPGDGVYLYRAIDQFGRVIDVLVAEKRILRPLAGFIRALERNEASELGSETSWSAVFVRHVAGGRSWTTPTSV